jgi:hypothetical protein
MARDLFNEEISDDMPATDDRIPDEEWDELMESLTQDIDYATMLTSERQLDLGWARI